MDCVHVEIRNAFYRVSEKERILVYYLYVLNYGIIIGIIK